MKINNAFLREKPSQMILTIFYNQGTYNSAYRLAIASKTTHNYASQIMKYFITCGLVEKTEKVGRSRPIVLTKKGMKVANAIHTIVELGAE